MREADFAAGDARQDLLFHLFRAVLEDHGAALAVGDEVRPGRRGDGAELLGDDVAVEVAALVAAVLLRPRHADPALGADALGELAVVDFGLETELRDRSCRLRFPRR